MAFQTGSQINPALGAINYSPYLQGSVAGSSAIGQGIAALGQGIASGIEQYQKQKKENKAMEAQLKANISSLEGLGSLSSGLSPEAQKTFGDTMARLNDPGVPITEKLALSQAAQKTVGELINFGIQAKEKQDATIAANAAYTASLQGGQLPMVLSPEVRAQAIPQLLAMQKQQADIAKLNAEAQAAGVSKPTAMVYPSPEAARKAGEAANQGYAVKVQPVPGGYGYEASQKLPEPANPNEALKFKRIENQLNDISASIKNDIALENSAVQIEKAIDSGKVTTGAFAPAISFIKRVGEAAGLEDLGATEQQLGEKGLNALQASSVRSIMQGLGSMSNADRDFATGAMPNITDTKQTIKYYAALAQENAKFAKEDQAYLRSQEKAGVPYEDILAELEQRRSNRQFAEAIYNRIIGASPKASPSPQNNSALRAKYGLQP